MTSSNRNPSTPPFNFSFAFNDVTLVPPEVDFGRDSSGGDNNDHQHHTHGGGDLISSEQYNAVLKFAAAIKMVICVGGIGCNALTIRVFLKMGVEDSVTLGFFNLAISDLNVLVSTLGTAAVMVCQGLERDYQVEFRVPLLFVRYMCIFYGRLFTYATTYFITFLAVQRCLCVVRPLHFKGVFTRGRTVVIVCVIWGYCAVSGGLIMGQFGLKRETDPGSNATTLVMAATPIYRWVRTNLSLANGIVLNVVCQALVSFCVFVMAHGLRKSVHFRQTVSSSAATVTTSTTRTQKKNQQDLKKKSENNPRPAGSNEADEKTGTSTTDGGAADVAVAVVKTDMSNTKERQAIVQVAIVSTIFLATCVPVMAISIARLFVSDLGPYRRYHNTYYTILAVRFTLESLNSAVNFFVYYNYNTRFRKFFSK